MHSEVALAVANQIQIQLAPEQQATLHGAPAIDQSAYDDYLKSRFYLTATAYTFQGLETAKRRRRKFAATCNGNHARRTSRRT